MAIHQTFIMIHIPAITAITGISIVFIFRGTGGMDISAEKTRMGPSTGEAGHIFPGKAGRRRGGTLFNRAPEQRRIRNPAAGVVIIRAARNRRVRLGMRMSLLHITRGEVMTGSARVMGAEGAVHLNPERIQGANNHEQTTD
jgi:hypothetical protein